MYGASSAELDSMIVRDFRDVSNFQISSLTKLAIHINSFVLSTLSIYTAKRIQPNQLPRRIRQPDNLQLSLSAQQRDCEPIRCPISLHVACYMLKEMRLLTLLLHQGPVAAGVIYLRGLTGPAHAVIRDSTFQDASTAVRLMVPARAMRNMSPMVIMVRCASIPSDSHTAARSASRARVRSPSPAAASSTPAQR